MQEIDKDKAVIEELFSLQDVSDRLEPNPWTYVDGSNVERTAEFWCDGLPESFHYAFTSDERWDQTFRVKISYGYFEPTEWDKTIADKAGTWELVKDWVEDPERECPLRTWDVDSFEEGQDLKVKPGAGECFLCGAAEGEVHRYVYAGHLMVWVYRLKPKIFKWRFISYDVWGNAEDGWEVNNAFNTSDFIELPEDFSEDDVMDAIKATGLCEDTSGMELDHNTDWETSLYLTRTADGFPEGEFRKEEV